MKHILLLALFTISITGADPAIEINKKYIGGTYTFSGSVEDKSGPTSSTCRFTGKTTADAFECEWIDDARIKGSVKVTANSGILTMPGVLKEQKFTDPMLAIAAATGVSHGSVHLMYALWKGQVENVFPSINVATSETKDGLLISGRSHMAGDTISVTTTKDNVITAIKIVTDPGEIKVPELSDQDISAALRSLGQSDTKEDIALFRKNMNLGQAALAGGENKMITTTTISVIWSE